MKKLKPKLFSVEIVRPVAESAQLIVKAFNRTQVRALREELENYADREGLFSLEEPMEPAAVSWIGDKHKADLEFEGTCPHCQQIRPLNLLDLTEGHE
jgi:hypothetical protein